MLSVSDFNDFEVFAVVANEGSLRKAAGRLSTSQPVVSQRITRLERNLGTALVERSTSGVRLTDAGRRLVPYLQRAFALMSEAVSAVRDATETGLLDVWADPTLAPVVIPFVSQSIAGIPVTLSNNTASVQEIVAAVREGDADVGFVHGDAKGAQLITEPFFKDELCFVVHPGHPLAHGQPVSVADVVKHEVAVAMCAPGAEIAISHLVTAGIPAEQLRRVTPAATATTLSMYNEHVGACLRSSAARALERGSLVQLELVDLPDWTVEISFVCRIVDVEREPIKTLREAVRQAWERKAIYLD